MSDNEPEPHDVHLSLGHPDYNRLVRCRATACDEPARPTVARDDWEAEHGATRLRGVDAYRAAQASQHNPNQCMSCGALPGHQRPDAAGLWHAYLLLLDDLDEGIATFTIPDKSATVVLSRSTWESLGRPGTINAHISPEDRR